MIPPADRTGRFAFHEIAMAFLLIVFLLALFGYCAKTSVDCWRHCGHVVKNVFDMPTCLEARP